jgi:proteasome lid subunit RPN8/RPN11
MKLHLSEKLYEEIEDLVMETNLETGVSLFGTKDGDDFTVVGIAGPGPKATHQEYHYSGDEDYKTDVYNLLLKENLQVEYIGELHAHPFGMCWLSLGDVDTANNVLKEFPYFIAGVMLRDPFEIFCWYFPGKERMEVICELQPRKSFRQTCRCYWVRLWRLRHRRYTG